MILPVTFSPLYHALTDPFARLDLITAAGGVVFEDRTMFAPGVASTPGMARGSRPVFWQSEIELLKAAQNYQLNLSGFPQALLLAVKGPAPLLVVRLVNPVPTAYFTIADLGQPTVTALINSIRALIPA